MVDKKTFFTLKQSFTKDIAVLVTCSAAIEALSLPKVKFSILPQYST